MTAVPLLMMIARMELIRTVPLVALVAVTVQAVLLIRYRTAVKLRTLWRLYVGSAAGIPFGVYMIKFGNRGALIVVLGVVIACYALYCLAKLPLPRIGNENWGFLAGAAGGFLGASASSSGPPVIIYGNASRWDRDEFKATLQGYFILSTFMVILGHAFAGNYTKLILVRYVTALPAIAIALFAGIRLSGHLNGKAFRTVVLWLLVVLGVMLIANGVRTLNAAKQPAPAPVRTSRSLARPEPRFAATLRPRDVLQSPEANSSLARSPMTGASSLADFMKGPRHARAHQGISPARSIAG